MDGSVYGAWLGIGLSLETVGLIGFSGTLAGGWLLRRGGTWRSILVPYFELTVATSLGLGRLMGALTGLDNSMSWLRAASLMMITSIVVVGATGRWHWLLRLTAALAWVLVFCGAGLDDYNPSRIPAPAAYVVYGALVFLLVRRWYLSARQPVAAYA